MLAAVSFDSILGAGGEKFEYIPALNDSQQHAESLLEIIKSGLDSPT